MLKSIRDGDINTSNTIIQLSKDFVRYPVQNSENIKLIQYDQVQLRRNL